jgi:hypothetical protein
MACVARGNARTARVLSWSPRVGRRGGALAGGSAVARRWQGVVGDLEGATGKVPSKEEGGRGAPERCADGEAVQTASGDGVQRRRGSSCGSRRAWRGPAARGRPGVRRRRSIEEWSSSEGALTGGGRRGDAWTESDVE